MNEDTCPEAIRDSTCGEYDKYVDLNGKLVLDLGAHVGYFSEYALKKGASFVIALEPHPHNFEELDERVRGMNAVAIKKAAWNVSEKRTLYVLPDHSGSPSLFEHEVMVQHCFDVGCIDIGRFLYECGIFPDFIKIDTEGSELTILGSLFASDIKTHMSIETHSSDLCRDCAIMCKHHGMKWLPEENKVGVCHALP